MQEHGTSGTQQMVQDFPIISAKTKKEEYASEDIHPFSENLAVEKSVPFDLPAEQPGFPYKRKVLIIIHDLRSFSAFKMAR